MAVNSPKLHVALALTTSLLSLVVESCQKLILLNFTNIHD